MGLIAKLKSIFKKSIDCSSELEDKFFHFYVTSGRKVNLGTNIIVKDGFCAVIVSKDKVLDVLYSGKHKIDNSTIPLAFKFLKLYKIDQNGHSPSSFKCDFYFIDLNTFKHFEFSSDVPFVRKKDPLGRVEAYSEGVADIKVEMPAKLVEYLLYDHAYIKDKAAMREIGLEIGNAVNKTLEKMNMSFGQMLRDCGTMNAFVNERLQNAFQFMGLSVSNIELTSFMMSSKLQKKVGVYDLGEKPELPDEDDMFTEFNLTLEDGTPVDLTSQILVDKSGEQSATANGDNLFMQSANSNYYANSQKQCVFCGKYITSTAKFCEHCGCRQDL